MKIKNLQQLEIFTRTAECGSLSAAARMLQLTPAVASAALKKLEADLGVLLFVRSTRKLRLTLEGERLLATGRPLLATLEAVEQELVQGPQALQGQLQISLPSDLGRNLMLPWLDQFQQQYPGARLRLHLSDRIADVYREQVDLAVRYGKPPDSSLVALPLAPDARRVLCAAPAYLERHGAPATPQALVGHNCLCFMRGELVNNEWRFSRDGAPLTVRVSGDRVGDDSDAVRRWTLAGHGVAYRSQIDVGPDIASGRLRLLCPDWQGEPAPLYLVCTDRRQLSPLARRLHDFLEQRLSALGTALPLPEA